MSHSTIATTSRARRGMLIALLSCPLALGIAGSAMAGEGGGDPFALNTPGQVVYGAPMVADVGSQAYPDMPAAYAFAPSGEPVLQADGQQGAVQTANSLPRGAMEGTVTYAQQQSVARYFAQQAARHYAARPTAHPGS